MYCLEDIYQALKYLLMIERMEATYFGLLPTYLLLISFKTTTFLLLLSSNIGKVAELWTLPSSDQCHRGTQVSRYYSNEIPILTPILPLSGSSLELETMAKRRLSGWLV